MFSEKIFNFSEPISRKTFRTVLLISFLVYQGARLLWKQGLIPPLLFFLVLILTEVIDFYVFFKSGIKKWVRILFLVFLILALIFEISHIIYFL